MSGLYRAPEVLASTHDVDGFHCRSRAQTEWLQRHARQSVSTGTTRVFVVTETAFGRSIVIQGDCAVPQGWIGLPAVKVGDAALRARGEARQED